MINNSRVDKTLMQLIAVAFYVSSFDIFLVIDVGFPLKVFFLVTLAAIAIWLVGSGKVKIRFIGLRFFLVWLLFLLLFIGNTTMVLKNLVYTYILIHYFLTILLITNVVDNSIKLIRAFKYYLYSFLFVGVFGCIQFAASLFGVDLLLSQYWIEGKLGRVNGFNYEPSYFASYMMLGWCTVFYLYFNKNFNYTYWQIQRSFLQKLFFFITIVILLSSSRLGIVMMALIMFSMFGYNLFKTLIRGKLNSKVLKYLSGFALLVVATIFYLGSRVENYSLLFSGLGIGGTASHSVDEREEGTINSLLVAKESIVFGVGLGGVQPAVAASHGVLELKPGELKDFKTSNIFLEVFASSSLLGFVFFILYLGSVFAKAFTKRMMPEFQLIINGLLLGLMCELIMLIFNENILRSYVWVHIAIINIVYFVGKNYKYEVAADAMEGTIE